MGDRFDKSAGKSANGRPFTGKGDPRNGRGPEPGSPNAGRLPSIVAAACRLSFEKRIPALCAIADGERVVEILHRGKRVLIAADAHARIKAIDLLAKYGGMSSIRVTDGDGKDVVPQVGVIVYGNREIPL